ncbi:phosphoserine phosphatase SerB [Paraglaciecola sp. L3A3]|uniref:phosphoserine phosphatase SerB n=1 Tax=Paraglaciecola sp. L3A3 TaxID=2686358 RepID=UPI00131C1C69|nr:phosphoserine phosphatase SerB [Paraglaciecola sp. L3A3]
MSDIAVSNKQINSHLFLADLVLNQDLQHFQLSDVAVKPIVEQTSSQADLQSLVMFTEGLHLGKLLQVTSYLKGYLVVKSYSALQMEGVAGFAIVANVSVLDNADLKQKLVAAAELLSVELCLVDKVPSLQQPGLLLMDMDSTVIAVECIDEIAALAGVGEEVASVTALAMQGKLDFAQSLRTRVSCLKGCDEAVIQQVRQALPLMPGIANLIAILKKANWKLAIASGGFTYFADYLAERLELDAAVANQLQISDGKLTGKVMGDIIDAQVKAETLVKLAEKWSIPIEQTIAMGDGANDLVMMSAASLGVAFHAKPVVRQQADISISKGGMDALIWILAARQ